MFILGNLDFKYGKSRKNEDYFVLRQLFATQFSVFYGYLERGYLYNQLLQGKIYIIWISIYFIIHFLSAYE